MKEEASSYSWTVDVSGQTYDASMDDLIQWIDEGALLSGDKVRRGNLRWIEAGKVPQLIPYFEAKASGRPPTSRVDALIQEQPGGCEQDTATPPPNAEYSRRATPGAGGCKVHADAPATLVCATCGESLCKGCPSSYGGVKICPLCGGLCNQRAEVEKEKQRATQFRNGLERGFGLEDFVRAIRHPFRFKSSLIFGAFMFAFFTFGQSATALGGIFMFCAALTCMMLANMLTFGVLANTVDNFSQGNIDANFMPDFDDFSLWEDVVHPFFLSLGVYISSFGIFIIVVLFGMYFVVSSMTAKSESMRKDIERIPGTHYYDTQRTVKQSENVKDLLGDVNKENANRLDIQRQIESGEQPATVTVDTEETVMKANETIQQQRKAQLESAFGKTEAESRQQWGEMVSSFMSLAAPLVVLSMIALAWGLFYFPAACAVAGYTRSFFATLNPLVGIDTISRLGVDYVKILGMGILLVIASAIIGFILGIIFLPFDLPGFGNLPAKVVSSLLAFYISIVFSCVLGLALYKNSAKLNLLR